MKEGSQEFVWAVVYRLARSELMRKVGIAHENPTDAAQQNWDAVVLSSHPSYDDMTKTMEKLKKARTRMVACGRFRQGDVESTKKEMEDLKKKVPKGSALRNHLYTRDYEPGDFDQFFNLVQKFQLNLPKSKEKVGLMTQSGDWPSDQWNQGTVGPNEQ